MAKPAVVKIVGDTKAYDRTIDQAAKKLNDFGKNGVGSLTSLMGAWGKLVPAIGAAAGGVATFEKVLNSSQAVGDAYNNTMGALKTTVDNFFTSLTTGDWSVFDRGISNVISKAYEAQVALDQLGNSTMSLGVINAKGQLDYQRLMTTLRGAKKGSDEYNKTLKDLSDTVGEMNTATEIVKTDQWKAVASIIASKTGLDVGEITFEAVLEGVTVDAKKNRQDIKDAAATDAKLFNQEFERLNKEFYTAKMVGFGEGTSVVQTIKDGKSLDDYKNRLSALHQQYSKGITINTLVANMRDDELKQIDELIEAYYRGELAIEQYRTQLARLGKEDGAGGGAKGGGAKVKVPEYNKGSIGDLQKYLTEVNETVMSATETEVRESALRLSKMISQEIDRLKGNAGYAITGSVSPVKTSDVKKDTQGITGLKDAAAKMDTSGVDTAVKKYQDLMEIQKEWAELNNGAMTQGVQSLTGAFSTLGNAIGGTEGAMISMIGQMAQEVVQGVMNIASLNAQKDALREKATAALGSAAAGAMEAHSWIPFAGVAIGVGMVATIISTLMSLPKFAQGGVVGGSSYNGDKVLARLNSGEMVLTQHNQQNLLRILNGGGMGQESGHDEVIRVKIENNQLVGTLSNASRRARYRV